MDNANLLLLINDVSPFIAMRLLNAGSMYYAFYHSELLVKVVVLVFLFVIVKVVVLVFLSVFAAKEICLLVIHPKR